MIDIDLNQSDVNQCARDQQLFSGSNKCSETTQVSSRMDLPVIQKKHAVLFMKQSFNTYYQF